MEEELKNSQPQQEELSVQSDNNTIKTSKPSNKTKLGIIITSIILAVELICLIPLFVVFFKDTSVDCEFEVVANSSIMSNLYINDCIADEISLSMDSKQNPKEYKFRVNLFILTDGVYNVTLSVKGKHADSFLVSTNLQKQGDVFKTTINSSTYTEIISGLVFKEGTRLKASDLEFIIKIEREV